MSLFGFTFMGIYGALFNLYLLRLGYGADFVGSVNGVGWIVYAVFAMPAGILSRRFGVRRLMIMGQAAVVAGLALVASAELVPAEWQRGWIMCTNVLMYLGPPLVWVNMAPVLMASSGPEEQAHAFSVQFALSPLAAFAGNLCGGFLPGLFASLSGATLDQPGPYRYALLVGALVLALGIWAISATRDADAEQSKRDHASRGGAPLALLAATSAFYLLRATGEFMVRTFFNVYMDTSLGVSTAQIGSILGTVQLLSVPAALAAPLLMARLREVRTVVLVVGGAGLAALPLALVPTLGAAAAGYLLMFVLVAIARPSAMVFTQQLVKPGWRPVMSGAVETVWGLGGAAASWMGGQMAVTVGYGPVFGAGAGFLVASALYFGASFRGKRVSASQA